MSPSLPRFATALTLALVAGALQAQAPTHAPAPLAPPQPPARLQAARALEPSRLAQARRLLASQLPALGPDDAQVMSTLTNPEGEAVIRFRQLHQGVPVYGTALVARVGAQGTLTIRQVEGPIQLGTTAPRLTSADALRAAHVDLTPTQPYLAQPRVERIVFPTRLIGGVEPRRDGASGLLLPDPVRSVAVGNVNAPHVWAYHVTRRVASDKGATTTLHAIVEGDRGVVLKKWIQGQDPLASGAVLEPARDYATQRERKAQPIRVGGLPNFATAPLKRTALAAAVAPVYTPATGTANTQFAGTVSIPTSFDSANNGYALLDTQRGAGGGAWTQTRGLTPGNRIITDQAWDYVVDPDTGHVTTFYYDYSLENGTFYDWSSGLDLNPGSPDNVWGNGLDTAKSGWQYPSPFSDDAKTSASEAMFAITTTYDVLNNVFGRAGIDNQDSSIIVQANMSYAMAGKAGWFPDMGMIQIGMGDPAAWGDTSGSIAVHNGAELTTIARELGVALHQSVVPYGADPAAERFHLERATGALLSQMAEAYAQRQPGDPTDAIPAASVDWMYGKTRADGRPFFWMDRPSRDGISPDAWFDGIWMLGSNYFDGFSFGDGPMNRAWYFMAEGASASSGSDAYSPYLPQGMTGIGLPKVARIFFKALTERYADTTGYHEARTACLAAATDLYGASSPETAAVANAFAAVNVGGAANQPDPVKVSFSSHLMPDGTPLAPFFSLQRFPVVPTGQWVKLHATVENTANTAVQWAARGVPGMMTSNGGATEGQGTFDASGAYMAPLKGDALWSVQARSVQDPLRFAQGVVWAFDIDGNGDGDVDALDFADFAMLCYLPAGVKNAINPNALFGRNTSITDPEIQLVTVAFNNAFNQ